jgi:pimeloyl-ACP methyl ester carboxylesterase
VIAGYAWVTAVDVPADPTHDLGEAAVITRAWADRAVLAGMEWMGRAALRGLPDPAGAADPPPAVDPDAPVVVVGGFAATAPVMAPVAAVLARRGHPVTVAVDGAGTGCAGRAADRLGHRIEALARQSGRRVHLVGHSRGGQFARVAASRAADSVASLTTLGSPVGLYGLGPVALGLGAAVTLVGTLGVPGLATISCLVGGCCRDYRTGLGSRWPDDVPLTRILGSADRTVPGDANHDPAAHEVVIEADHLALLTCPAALRAVTDAIDRAERPGRAAGIAA